MKHKTIIFILTLLLVIAVTSGAAYFKQAKQQIFSGQQAQQTQSIPALESASSLPISAYISGDNPTSIYVRYVDGSTRQILSIDQLPDTSVTTFGIMARSFSSAALAPNKQQIAFATNGYTHGLVGLLDLNSRDIRELSFLFGGGADELAWSPNGRYLAMSESSPSGIMEIGVLDISTGKRLLLGDFIRTEFFQKSIKTFRPTWSADGTQLSFKGKLIGSRQAPCTWWVITIDGSDLKQGHECE